MNSTYWMFISLCSSGLVVLPCSSTSCRFGARCRFEKGYPECVCPLESDCPRQDKPVCGTDGQNYPNECVLKARACLMRKDVEAEYDGHCGTKIYIQWFVMTFCRNNLNLLWSYRFLEYHYPGDSGCLVKATEQSITFNELWQAIILLILIIELKLPPWQPPFRKVPGNSEWGQFL